MLRITAGLACLLIAAPAYAGHRDDFEDYVMPEPYSSGWSFYADNDAMSLVNRDQQYTGGFALTLSGRRATEYPVSLDGALHWLDRVTGAGNLYQRTWRRQLHSLELGLLAFTPENITTTQPVTDDQPYASLVYLGNTQHSVLLQEQVSVTTNFTLGILGSRVPETVQNQIHAVLGQDSPNGWRNQVSDGGELTFLYGLARQRPVYMKHTDTTGVEIKAGFGGSIGFVSQLVAGINWRWGILRTPWWSFAPGNGEYASLGQAVPGTQSARPRKELYVWSDLNLRYRLYNAFLQGQFRPSPVRFERSELEPVQLEWSLGLTTEMATGFRLGVFIRARTAEIKAAEGLPPVWGGLVLSRSY